MGRTPEGGMGYIDAYGNPVRNRAPEERTAPRHEEQKQAGSRAAQQGELERPLPDSAADRMPVWNFR
jgi:hypothetical protein